MYDLNIHYLKYSGIQVKTDPSDVMQHISNVQISLLCCRYWMMTSWEGKNLSAPFWRIYYNTIEGATLTFNNRSYPLTKESLVLIPPNTQYSTSLNRNQAQNKPDAIFGRKIESTDEISEIAQKGAVDHMFIHFSLGMAYNMIAPDVYIFALNNELAEIIELIKQSVVKNNRILTVNTSLQINLLIFHVLKVIPENKWGKSITDLRVINAMSYIQENSHLKITNEQLAANSNMAVNSFARLFKNNCELSIQQYVQKTRVEQACDLMHHTKHSIDEIALLCGFYDRHHFSKAFKQQLNITPSYYLKNHTMS